MVTGRMTLERTPLLLGEASAGPCRGAFLRHHHPNSGLGCPATWHANVELLQQIR
jgi:hypothetical protein